MDKQLISLAEVTDRTDVTKNGSFLAKIEAIDDDERRIMYATPYASGGQGAFIAIPEVGVEVLVVRPSCSDFWYYMGSTFNPEPRQTTGSSVADAYLLPAARAAAEATKVPEADRGIPDTLSLTDKDGAGLVINGQYTPTTFNRQVRLQSSTNKTISLNDSPGIDSIVLDSGNGSTLKLTSEPGGDGMAGAVMGVPNQAFLVDTQGPQRLIGNSQIDIVVAQGGRELQLLNQANDVNWGG